MSRTVTGPIQMADSQFQTTVFPDELEVIWRRRSRWLAPEGGLDNIRLPAIILRGILDNFAVLLPLMMIAVLVTEQLFGIAYRVGLDRLHYAPLIGAAVFAVIALAQPVLYRLFSGRYLYSWPARNRYEQILSIALVLEIVVLVLVPTFLLVQQAIDLDWNGVKAWYGEYGQLVYLKSSMTGDEPDTIRQYREVHPTFPQESSSNQAFTEPQFEAYRALGEHIITTVIAETAKGVSGGVHVDWPVDLRA